MLANIHFSPLKFRWKYGPLNHFYIPLTPVFKFSSCKFTPSSNLPNEEADAQRTNRTRMKKIILSAAIIAWASALSAQKSKAWFEVGLKGGGGISVIVNKNLWDDKKTVAPSISGCYSYGGKLAINFTENHHLAFEGIWGMRSQKYQFLIDKVTYDKKLTLNVNDLALLYRYNGSNGGYVELGGQYTLVNKATEVNNSGSVDVKNNFTSYTSGVLGFGGNMAQSGSFTWTMGVRITYAFTDAISAAGGAGQGYSYPLNDPIIRKEYTSYKMTKPITVQVLTEFNFDLGYFARSNCKRGRVTFLSF